MAGYAAGCNRGLAFELRQRVRRSIYGSRMVALRKLDLVGRKRLATQNRGEGPCGVSTAQELPVLFGMAIGAIRCRDSCGEDKFPVIVWLLALGRTMTVQAGNPLLRVLTPLVGEHDRLRLFTVA